MRDKARKRSQKYVQAPVPEKARKFKEMGHLQVLKDGCWKQELFFDDPEPNSEVVELAEWFAAKDEELGFAPNNKSLETVAPTLEPG